MATDYEKWLNKPKGTKDYGSYQEWLKHQKPTPPTPKAKMSPRNKKVPSANA